MKTDPFIHGPNVKTNLPSHHTVVFSTLWTACDETQMNPCFRVLYGCFFVSVVLQTYKSAFVLSITVPTFNSCTKCVGSPGMINDRTSDCHPGSLAWMHRWSRNWTYLWFAVHVCHSCAWLIDVIDVLGLLFWHAIHECLYTQTLADVR